MNKIKLLFKISFQYWRHHKKRFYMFMIALILGVSALNCAALLIRSEKQAVLDEELRLLGDYDLIVYGTDTNTATALKTDGRISDMGMYYEMGYAVSENGVRTGAAAFCDTHSEKMYHMTCLRGEYPKSDNEIALDINTAKAMGISPYPGQAVRLELCSNAGEKLSENVFTVSGIFEASNVGVYGGWYRYPSQMEIDNWDMPGVFFSSDTHTLFQSSQVTAFMQSDAADMQELCEDCMETADGILDWEQIEAPGGRRYAYTYVLGITDTIRQKYGDDSISSIRKAVKNGDGIRDFYSGVLMPVFMALVSVIVIFSVTGITKNILKDKQDNFAVLRSLGMENRHLALYIVCDFTAAAFICICIGFIISMLLHCGMICFLNSARHLNLQYGFSCSAYVNSVTVSPFLATFLTVLICVETAVLFSLARFVGRTPIMIFDSRQRKRRVHIHRDAVLPKSWKSLLSSKINLHNGAITAVSIIVMGAALFGYTYFHALADLNNTELEFEKQEYGLDKWDYKAEKSSQSYMYEFHIENHHEYGINPEVYAELKKQPFAKRVLGKIVNASTRITFPEGALDDAAASALSAYSLRQYADIDDSDMYEQSLQDAEDAMIQAVGYDRGEMVYSLPTIGLLEEDISRLREYVVDGEIDVEQLNAGNAVLLAMTEDDWEIYAEIFHAGDILPLSDIILDAGEERLDFGRLIPSEVTQPVYKKMVITPEGDEVELTSYAFGKRKDIPVKIGAVLVLDDAAAMQYMYSEGEEGYGANAFCSAEEFGAWGLPDCNFTNICMETDDGYALEEIDKYWYSALSGCKGISIYSTAEITSQMYQGTQKIMSVYYCMIIILITVAAVTAAISLYTDIRLRSTKFAICRACGMSVSQIAYLIIRQNLFYPLAGVLFSVVPVAVCQRFFFYIRENVDSGVWDSLQFQGTAWYHDVPFRYNLFAYHLPVAVAAIFAVYLLIIFVITIPQLYFISNQPVTAEIEKSKF